jgi:hypothetical protein
VLSCSLSLLSRCGCSQNAVVSVDDRCVIEFIPGEARAEAWQSLKVARLGPCEMDSPLVGKLSALREFVSDELFVRAKILETAAKLSESENGSLLSASACVLSMCA